MENNEKNEFVESNALETINVNSNATEKIKNGKLSKKSIFGKAAVIVVAIALVSTIAYKIGKDNVTQKNFEIKKQLEIEAQKTENELKIEALEKENEKIKARYLLEDFEEIIAEYDEELVEMVKDQIDDFKANPTEEKLEDIVNKLNALFKENASKETTKKPSKPAKPSKSEVKPTPVATPKPVAPTTVVNEDQFTGPYVDTPLVTETPKGDQIPADMLEDMQEDLKAAGYKGQAYEDAMDYAKEVGTTKGLDVEQTEGEKDFTEVLEDNSLFENIISASKHVFEDVAYVKYVNDNDYFPCVIIPKKNPIDNTVAYTYVKLGTMETIAAFSTKIPSKNKLMYLNNEKENNNSFGKYDSNAYMLKEIENIISASQFFKIRFDGLDNINIQFINNDAIFYAADLANNAENGNKVNEKESENVKKLIK